MMPVGKGKYRVKTTSTGKQERLHFTPTGVVNEVKVLGTNKTHTPAEFAADRKKKKGK
jgi:hypothetical protein